LLFLVTYPEDSSMRASKRDRLSSELAGVEQRFTKWRRTRKLGTRIPERLWASAVKLTATYGLHPTASTLRLDYYSLKKRVERASADYSGRPAQSMQSFVELAAPHASELREWVIDLENDAGARMRIHVKGGEALDVVALGRSFWRDE
jgi:hypothetical protein